MIDDKFFYSKLVGLITTHITLTNATSLLDMSAKFNFTGIEEIKQAVSALMS